MKFLVELERESDEQSHPTRGAWIEMSHGPMTAHSASVAPHTGCVD